MYKKIMRLIENLILAILTNKFYLWLIVSEVEFDVSYNMKNSEALFFSKNKRRAGW